MYSQGLANRTIFLTKELENPFTEAGGSIILGSENRVESERTHSTRTLAAKASSSALARIPRDRSKPATA